MQNMYLDTPSAVAAELRPVRLNDVQLVACVSHGAATASSCGTYQRESDGAVGELRRTVGTTTIRILVAGTGRQVAEKKLVSQPLPCNTRMIQHSSGPPWVEAADPPGFGDAQTYLTGLTIGPAPGVSAATPGSAPRRWARHWI